MRKAIVERRTYFDVSRSKIYDSQQDKTIRSNVVMTDERFWSVDKTQVPHAKLQKDLVYT